VSTGDKIYRVGITAFFAGLAVGTFATGFLVSWACRR